MAASSSTEVPAISPDVVGALVIFVNTFNKINALDPTY
jgi:hypothetical protein